MTRFVGGVVTAAFLLLLAAAPVLAHAELEESDPADGETIVTPYTLTATYSEPLGTDRSRIVVESVATGAEVARGGISADDPSVMTVELPSLEPGEYTANWTAVTPDDQGVTRGTFTFIVAAEATATPTSTPRPSASATAAPRTAVPTPSAAPTPATTPNNGDAQTAAGGNDVLLALALAAAVLLGLGLYLFTRSRR